MLLLATALAAASMNSEVQFGDLCVLKTEGTPLLKSTCAIEGYVPKSDFDELKEEVRVLKLLLGSLIPPSPPPPVSPPPLMPPPVPSQPPPPSPVPSPPPPSPRPPAITISDCHEYKVRNPSAVSGGYRSETIGSDVYCDMDTDGGYGYTVIARIASAGGIGVEGDEGIFSEYYTTGALGSSTYIDASTPNSVVTSNQKLSDDHVNNLLANRALNHRFKWHTTSDDNEYLYFQIKPGSSFMTTATMEQRCTRTVDGPWSPFYQPGNDYGLSSRDYPNFQDGKTVRCRYNDDNCPDFLCENGQSLQWDSFITTKHSGTFWDICGRSARCGPDRQVIILFAAGLPEEQTIEDCHMHKLAYPSAASGKYTVNLGDEEVDVYCDMDSDGGWGYTVIARFGSGTVCAPGVASCSPTGVDYFTTNAIGASYIDPTIENSGVAGPNKLSDAIINKMLAKGSSGHRFKWYTNFGSGTEEYVYLQIQNSFAFTNVMTQRCTRTPSGSWSDWYTATNDYGLTTRSYSVTGSSSLTVRCRYNDDNCPGFQCANGHVGSGTWNGFFTTRHSTSYLDICGRQDADAGQTGCTNERNAFILFSAGA